MRAETRHPVRQLVQTEPCGSMRNDKTFRIEYPHIPLADRFEAFGGAVKRDRARLNRIIQPDKKFTELSNASKKKRSKVSPEARPSEILFKPTEEQNHRLIRGLSAGREALLVSGCRTMENRIFVSV